MTETENERREERNEKEGWTRVRQVLSGGRKATYGTCEGVWREYITIYDSRSYNEYRVREHKSYI